ncbi:MAG: hypothetical protein ACJA2W_002826 [Planctomycetota bacterium]|jgi:hypothetical protein
MKTPLQLILVLTAGLAFGSTAASAPADLQKPDSAGAQDAGKKVKAADGAKKAQVREVKGDKAKRVKRLKGVTEKAGPETADQGKPGAKDAGRVKEAREKGQAQKDEARTKAARTKDAAKKSAGKGFDRNAVALFGKEVRKHRVVQARLDRLATLFAEDGKEAGVARVAALRAKETARYGKVIARFESMLGADQFATIRARLETGGRGRGAGKGKTKPKKQDADAGRQGEKKKDADN